MTDFENVCGILGSLYTGYKDDKDFEDFIEFNDLGLPLAFLASEKLCEVSEDGRKYILETWDLFLAALGIEDEGFNNLDELLNRAQREE